MHYFRLKREYDRTGTFTLGEEVGIKSRSQTAIALQPDTEYKARLGTLTIDDPKPDDDSISGLELAKRLPEPSVWWDDLLSLPDGNCSPGVCISLKNP